MGNGFESAAAPAKGGLPRVVILTALQVEYEAVRAHLKDVEEETHPLGTVYERGIFVSADREWEVIIAEIGAGNATAAIEMERAIQRYSPMLVLFVGVAGGVKDVEVGHVVAATKVYLYEAGKESDTFQPRPSVGVGDRRLLNRARAEARKQDWRKRILGRLEPKGLTAPPPKAWVAPIAAGEKVVASKTSSTHQMIRGSYSDAVAVEVEGYGALAAAHAASTPALVIRGISDLIEGKEASDKAGSQELASSHASAFAFQILAKLDPDLFRGYRIEAVEEPDTRVRSSPLRPSTLTAVAMTTRPQAVVELVGREADLEWFQETSGDRLLVGHPGSGKTSLLAVLARQTGALFVSSEDIDLVREDVVSTRPSCLIVDDAHLKGEMLRRLLELRQLSGASYSLVASSWQAEQDRLGSLLDLPKSKIRELRLLSRDEIVRVINLVGLEGPVELIREIVNQAEGRPGLAVTLAQLCLNDGVRDVALGDALSRAVRTSLLNLVGAESEDLLAVFALGGDAGIPLNVAAEVLGLTLASVRKLVANLAAGGVVSEVLSPRTKAPSLVVRPPMLRWALVRDVFFNGPVRLPYEDVIANANSSADVALTLVSARAIGARIDEAFLVDFLESIGSSEAWGAFAWSGSPEAQFVARRHPELALILARPLLYSAPEAAIPLLLKSSVGDRRQLSPNPDHPLRLIRDWIEDTEPDSAEAVDRRGILAQVAGRWIDDGGDDDVGTHALAIALTPKFDRHFIDPGQGRTVTIRNCPLSPARLEEVGGIWPQVLARLKRMQHPAWAYLLEAISPWVYPVQISGGKQLPPEYLAVMKRIASQMIMDLSTFIAHEGAAHRLDSFAESLGLQISAHDDRPFRILFPRRPKVPNEEALNTQSEAVRQLATEWSRRDVDAVFTNLETFEEQARTAGIRWPRYTDLLCRNIAGIVDSPLTWARHGVGHNVPLDVVEPFISAAAARQEAGWQGVLSDWLKDPRLACVAVSVILREVSPPLGLLNGALSAAKGCASLVETLCLRGQIPSATLLRLLDHEDAVLACEVAIAEWGSDARGSVRDEFQDAWRSAILRFGDVASELERTDHFRYEHVDHGLAEILRGEGRNLALRWLAKRLRTFKGSPFDDVGAADRAAMAGLSTEQRTRLMATLPGSGSTAALVRLLVGDDLEAYQGLLNSSELGKHHLAPLGERPNAHWLERAKLALSSGYTPAQVVGATVFGITEMTWGEDSDYWQGWIEDFSHLLTDPDPMTRRIAEEGIALAKRNRQQALVEEQRRGVIGEFG